MYGYGKMYIKRFRWEIAHTQGLLCHKMVNSSGYYNSNFILCNKWMEKFVDTFNFKLSTII